jgi:hypothetical protein
MHDVEAFVGATIERQLRRWGATLRPQDREELQAANAGRNMVALAAVRPGPRLELLDCR